MTDINALCGEVIDIFYDKKMDHLNLELAVDTAGTPLILFQDWTKGKGKTLFTLHIKEAIRLKSRIDNIAVDYVMHCFQMMGEGTRWKTN